jgi:hypothetical protein
VQVALDALRLSGNESAATPNKAAIAIIRFMTYPPFVLPNRGQTGDSLFASAVTWFNK